MAPQRPQDLVFTLFGDYLLHRPGSVWVGTLIALLEPLGVSESAVRNVLSRMTSKGWLESRRSGRNSFYRLTASGRRLLEEGEERIYRPPLDRPWDGRWSLVAYSIPEDNRGLRDRLRVRLSWLGFGPLGNGLWISPHEAGEELARLAGELGVEDWMEAFRGELVGFSSAGELVARCWDLEGLQERYVDFIDELLPRYRRAEAALEAGDLAPEASFVERFSLVHHYREFPLADPYLPQSLVPEGWAGGCAAGLFNAYHDLLEEPSERFVEAALGSAPFSPEATAARTS